VRPDSVPLFLPHRSRRVLPLLAGYVRIGRSTMGKFGVTQSAPPHVGVDDALGGA